MYPSNFQKLPTLVCAATSLCTRNQPTNQKENGGKIKLTIADV